MTRDLASEKDEWLPRTDDSPLSCDSHQPRGRHSRRLHSGCLLLRMQLLGSHGSNASPATGLWPSFWGGGSILLVITSPQCTPWALRFSASYCSSQTCPKPLLVFRGLFPHSWSCAHPFLSGVTCHFSSLLPPSWNGFLFQVCYRKGAQWSFREKRVWIPAASTSTRIWGGGCCKNTVSEALAAPCVALTGLELTHRPTCLWQSLALRTCTTITSFNTDH